MKMKDCENPFSVGETIVCIEDADCLTVGKDYKVFTIGWLVVIVENDEEENQLYMADKFRKE